MQAQNPELYNEESHWLIKVKPTAIEVEDLILIAYEYNKIISWIITKTWELVFLSISKNPELMINEEVWNMISRTICIKPDVLMNLQKQLL
ncbi:MAG: hypothetical protein ACD_4C00343G0007 [uncultured bacterium (gcode 4)]|uniref:Uncharacterized protein n=1 Tax=uncultured bacterium (gcode 4) TaxID=1234023 RepID=K2FWN1_9BACT|nr:MAG: hypothetical protein ACD_4C00343G0007 [uncultured bacterium (gcode 4)]